MQPPEASRVSWSIVVPKAAAVRALPGTLLSCHSPGMGPRLGGGGRAGVGAAEGLGRR